MRRLRATDRSSEAQRHAIDGMIAATALDYGAVLVSNDAVFVRLAKLAPDLPPRQLGRFQLDQPLIARVCPLRSQPASAALPGLGPLHVDVVGEDRAVVA